MRTDLVKLFKSEEQKQGRKDLVVKRVIMLGIAGVGAYIVKKLIDRADQKVATDIGIMVDGDLLYTGEDIYSDEEVDKWVQTCKKEEKERNCSNCGKCKRKYVVVGQNGKRQPIKEKVDLKESEETKETDVKEPNDDSKDDSKDETDNKQSL